MANLSLLISEKIIVGDLNAVVVTCLILCGHKFSLLGVFKQLNSALILILRIQFLVSHATMTVLGHNEDYSYEMNN